MSNLSKLITPVSDADKAAFEKITSERTSFTNPPMTALEEAEMITVRILADLAKVNQIMEANESKIDFSSLEKLLFEAEDRAMTALVNSIWNRRQREAGLL